MNLNKIPENLKQILVSIAKEKDAEMSKIQRDSELPDRLTEIFEMWKIETLSIKKNSGHYNPHRPCSPINTAGLDSIHKKGLINKKEYEPLIKEYHKLWSCLYDKKRQLIVLFTIWRKHMYNQKSYTHSPNVLEY